MARISLDALDVRVKGLEKRVAKLEDSNSDMTDVKVSIQKLTDVSKNLVEAVKEQNDKLNDQNNRITAIEKKPAEDYEKLKSGALTKVGGLIGLAIIVTLVAVILWLVLK